jgi:hypothetical protein
MFTLKIKPITSYQVGSQLLEVIRTTRKSSIALKLRANNVVIFVPKHYSMRRLTKVLNTNQTWLIQGLKKLEQRRLSQPECPKFNGRWGDKFDFLGRPVHLACESEQRDRGGKKLNDFAQAFIIDQQCILAETLQTNSLRCAAIETLMRQVAQEDLAKKLPYYAEKVGVVYQSVTVKSYKARWGSCHSDGRLQFNWRLWQAPAWVIEYVMVHELCHLVHANHSKAFWALVTQHFSQTPEAKRYIKQYGQRWIQFLQ